MRAAATDTKFKAVLYIYDNSVTNTAKVNKYARKGSVVAALYTYSLLCLYSLLAQGKGGV